MENTVDYPSRTEGEGDDTVDGPPYRNVDVDVEVAFNLTGHPIARGKRV